MNIYMRFVAIIISLMLISDSILAQVYNRQDSLILTDEQNDRWLGQLEQRSLEDKLKMIKSRILADTAIYVRRAFADRIKVEDQYKNELRIQGACRPFLMFGGQGVYIENETSVQTVKDIADLLTTKEIREARVLRDKHAQALFGSRAACGVIILEVKNKSVSRKVRKVMDANAKS